MATGDVYKLVMHVEHNGNDIQNRFYWQMTAGSGNAEGLAVAFEDAFVDLIIPFLSDEATVDLIEVENLSDASDTFTQAGTKTGLSGATPVGDFYALAFELVPNNTIVRKGRKAFGPTTESVIAGTNIDSSLNAERILLEQGLAGALNAVIGSSTYNHVLYSPPNSSHAFVLVTDVISGGFKRMSTQSTRKISS